MITQSEFSEIKNKFSKNMSYFDVIELCKGNLDIELSIFIFEGLFQRLPENKEELNITIIIEMANRIKVDFQKNLDDYLSKKYKKQPQFLIKQLSKKSDLGSIKDIANKFGLSISYIRELKKDNILDICYQIFNDVTVSSDIAFKHCSSNVFDLNSLKKNNNLGK